MNTRIFSNSFATVFPFRSLVCAMALLASVWLASAQPGPLSVWTNRPYTLIPGDYRGPYAFRRVIYAQEIFATVGGYGDEGVIITSPDGLQWTSQSVTVPGFPPNGHAVYDICYGIGRFVAVGWCGTTMTGNGTKWTENYVGRCITMEGVTYGSGYFVAVGYPDGGTTNSLVSTDGTNWVIRKSGTGLTSMKHVAYGNGEFIATSDYGLARATTSGLSNPSAIPLFSKVGVSTTPTWDVAFGVGVFVITGPNGINVRALGDSLYTSVNATAVSAVGYTPAGFVAVTSNGGTYLTSLDGTNWLTHAVTVPLLTPPYSTSQIHRSIAIGAGRMVAVADLFIGHSGPLAQLAPSSAAGEMFLTGVPSWRYRIEQRNLTQTNGWQFVTNHTLATGTPTGFIRDVQATNSSSRIYRAVLPAP